MKYTKCFWADDRAAASGMMVVLLTSLLAIGMVVGITAIRDSVVQEFGDMAVALDQLNQSYTTSAYTINGMVYSGSTFTDVSTLTDPPSSPPACLVLGVSPRPEG